MRTPKQEQQHKAWRKWYDSDKGKEYRQKRKEQKGLEPEPVQPVVELEAK